LSALVPGTGVEIVLEPTRGRVRHALFDFDGTLSTLRDGWQDFMVPLMVEVLEECPRHESRAELERIVIGFVDELTGKQTIYQMLRLAEEVARRGGTPRDPLDYKAEYNRRLAGRVERRVAEIRRGEKRAEDFLVAGTRGLLEELARRGVRSYLASGTDIEYVREEARILGLESAFEGGIFGALTVYKDFSKEMVVRKILADFALRGPELLVVGDGFVEIQNGRDVGAVTWGVWSREGNRYHMNAEKRARLTRAGAQLLSPDLAEGKAVLDYLEVG
jgi:phosphoglycolate phosphatase-like HAD superfamily hydrolase